jgi:hypothetical protein
MVDDASSLLLFDLGFARLFQFSEQLVVNFPAHWLLHLTELGAEVLRPTEPADGIAAMCPLLGVKRTCPFALHMLLTQSGHEGGPLWHNERPFLDPKM